MHPSYVNEILEIINIRGWNSDAKNLVGFHLDSEFILLCFISIVFYLHGS
jgi:hypothetical protein